MLKYPNPPQLFPRDSDITVRMICSVVAPGIPKLYIVPPFCVFCPSLFPIGALLLFFSVLSENLLLPPSANSTDPRAAVSFSQFVDF
ncbi:hypothetical protein, partial [Thiolapillus sp.]|uniref:hypothetical protein n=1 Tax=Thiolapillus sp. TaxID=2017437 RepID=UPI003AF63B59